MKKSTIIIITILIVSFVGLGVFISIKNATKKEEENALIEEYDLYSVIKGDENNGGIGDHIKGLVEGVEPELYIFEYADYQCSGCAIVNPWVNEILDIYEGRVVIVYRSFPLTSIHPNAKAAASAAEAAGLQGYWKEYANLLFTNQAEWQYLTGAGRKEKLIEYFNLVSDNKGDEKKFVKDMTSEEVSKKVSFDTALGNRIGINATPSLYLDGEEIPWADEGNTKTTFVDFMKKTIDAKLNK